MTETRAAAALLDVPPRSRAHPPVATALAALPRGRFLRCRARGPVPITAWLPASAQQRALIDLARVPQLLACFVERLGPYPSATCTIVVADDELPALEGVVVVRAGALDGTGRCDGMLAEALARQWFHRSAAPAAAPDAWLAPALARYATWLWCEAVGEATTDALARAAHVGLAGGRGDDPRADPDRDGAPADPLAARGALLLHALRIDLGDVLFFDLLPAWSALHGDGSGTTEDFRRMVGALAGRPLDALLDAWLDDRALPPVPERRTRGSRRHRR